MQDMKAWEKDIDEKTRTWLKESNRLTVTVIGRTGTGKTSHNEWSVRQDTWKGRRHTKPRYSTCYMLESKIQGVNVMLWDTPGLQDGMCKYLQEMIESGCINANLKYL